MPEVSNIQEKLRGRRIVALSNKINQEQADKLRAKLLELTLESNDEIRLLIDSDGGGVSSALSIYGAINCIKAPVIGIVVGNCWSMAVPILQACKKRLAMPHSVFLLHYVSTSFDFSHHLSSKKIREIFERRLLEGRRWQAESERIIAERTQLSRAAVRRLMQEGDMLDARISPGEAIRHNLIDEILRDPKLVFAER